MSALTRRRFAELLAAGGPLAVFTEAAFAESDLERLLRPSRRPPPFHEGENYWSEIREQFFLPEDLAFFNAANLCPAPIPVVEALLERTRRLDRDPSPQVKGELQQERELVRQKLAAYLRVSPEEIVITRNTSEANNLVSSGLDLGPGDEVVIFSDNHPSNHAAWREKARRFGFSVKVVEQVNPHPGADYYLEAFSRAMTSRTRVVAFTHVTNTAGDLLPAKELCALAREKGALSLVDGAQSFGVLDVDLSDMQPDFYTGSAHKWPCGPREAGLLYVNRQVHDRIYPTIVSLYGGAVGISRVLEAMGQRDEPAMIAFGAAIDFQLEIGRAAVEKRAYELRNAAVEELRRIPGVKLWSHPDPARSGAVVTFLPGNLDPRKLAEALYREHGIVLAARGGEDRPGLRLSPHLYNLHAEVERTVAALRRYLSTGL
ncbi:MAG: aminotransferase class V [Gemmatimonadales bacterium]|nr:MAG: aminotransferase class V [Gemmatimonadales bacterium]